jgi:hypothetical protein
MGLDRAWNQEWLCSQEPAEIYWTGLDEQVFNQRLLSPVCKLHGHEGFSQLVMT